MLYRLALRFIAVVFATILIGSPAFAGLVLLGNSGGATVDAAFFNTSFPSRHDEASYGPLGGGAVADINTQFGRLRAVQLDIGLNAVRVDGRVADIPSFDYSAGTDIALDVGNTGAPTPLDFEFTINGGQLVLRGRNGSFNGLSARVGVSIFTITPGFSGFLWAWTQSLVGSGSSVTTSISFFIDPMNFGTPAVSPITINGDEATMDIAPFHVTQRLATLSGSGTAFITYDMDAGLVGVGLNNTGGVAALGDPFGVNTSPGSTIAIRGLSLTAPAATVPGPSTLYLLAVALGLLGLKSGMKARSWPV
jgi:hypothetical protein